jgi:SAM-dependent methyltransferase
MSIKNLYHFLCGYGQHWTRVIMDKETASYVASLNYKTFKALEISGSKWEKFGFASYRSIAYPEYDLCKGVLDSERFDIIIAEQVLEHALYPYRAVQNLYRMLNHGGVVVITTPLLLKIHECPFDCSRWTEVGIKYLLIEGGFNCDGIKTGSWGNRACIVANFKKWVNWVPWKHSLKNEPSFPVVVWAFAWK